jgi:hypothetical protein
MKRPNPDPHPSREDTQDEISPERILWKQTDRFLEAQFFRDLAAMHGAVSGLGAIITPGMRDEQFDSDMAHAFDQHGEEERMLATFSAYVSCIERRGKWIRNVKEDVMAGKEWRQAFG